MIEQHKQAYMLDM